MYNITAQQIEAEKKLKKEGFRFSNWISAQEENPELGCMVMKRKPNKFTTEYREISPDGSVN